MSVYNFITLTSVKLLFSRFRLYLNVVPRAKKLLNEKKNRPTTGLKKLFNANYEIRSTFVMSGTIFHSFEMSITR
jgi:hypothetical protein